ncbi:CbrC family protein [Lentzea terrae]|uniref:CbrC family protein n=1 Tax=Lentzea terrae TaxID=2200761 RepID=UPI0018E4DCB7|nr:CbrC family protein [Lentzea terrae]
MKPPPRAPSFRYHPEPLETGSVDWSDQVCACCGEARGLIYKGPVHATEKVSLCPWCIEDGSAAEKFDATFTDADAPAGVPEAVVDEICRRTPGFSGWQQERWLFHCGDGAEFLGSRGGDELSAAARDAVRQELRGWSDGDIGWYLDALTRDGSPTAFLFRCLVCGTHLAYTDST